MSNMKNYDDHLSEALLAGRVDKLPKACTGPWEGLAIIKVRKVGGKEVYCLGTWNEAAKTANIAEDYDTLMQESFVEAYPLPNLKKEAEDAALKDKADKIKADLEAVYQAKLELKDLGVDNPEGTLEELKAQILSIKAGKDEVELKEMQEFLLNLGYDSVWCGRLTLESAKASVEKMKAIQESIVELGETPASTKDEMVEQLKRLKKNANSGV